MMSVEIRQQLHQYIDAADDKNIEAIYTILQGNMQQGRFSPEDLKKFYDRREEYLKGNTEIYSVEEAHSIIRQGRKQK